MPKMREYHRFQPHTHTHTNDVSVSEFCICSRNREAKSHWISKVKKRWTKKNRIIVSSSEKNMRKNDGYSSKKEHSREWKLSQNNNDGHTHKKTSFFLRFFVVCLLFYWNKCTFIRRKRDECVFEYGIRHGKKAHSRIRTWVQPAEWTEGTYTNRRTKKNVQIK